MKLLLVVASFVTAFCGPTNKTVFVPAPIELPSTPRGIAFAQQGGRMAIGVETGEIIIWNITTGSRETTLPRIQGDRILDLAFTPDGDFLLARGSSNPCAVLWHVSTRRSRDFPGECQSVALHPDGRILAMATSRGAELVEVSSGRVIRVFEVARPILLSLAFSPNGRSLATGTSRGDLQVWDLDRGTPSRLSNLPFPIRGLAWSPTGTHIVSASAGGETGNTRSNVRMFPLAGGSHRDLQYTFWNEEFEGLQFSPDGEFVSVIGAWWGRGQPSGRAWPMSDRYRQFDVEDPNGITRLGWVPGGGVIAVGFSYPPRVTFHNVFERGAESS